MEYPANNVFPAAIIRMRLAGINNLELAGVLGNLPETIEIGQDQVGALVSCCAARETDRESLRLKLEASLLAHRLEQIELGDQMSRPNFFRGQAQRAASCKSGKFCPACKTRFSKSAVGASFKSRNSVWPGNTRVRYSIGKRSCPAGTGVCVVKTHLLRTFSMSSLRMDARPAFIASS